MKRPALAFTLLLITMLAWPTLSGGGQAVSAAAVASNLQAGVALSGSDHSRDSLDLSSRILNLLNAGALQAACPPADTRIMPLGDSITHGTHGNNFPDTRPDSEVGGYRLPLYAGLRNAGYSVDFVGSVITGNDYSNFDFQHEGHRGWRDNEIAAAIYDWLDDTPAEIILLHIGTNGLNSSPDDVEDILDEINRYEQDSATDIITIVARIINRINYSATTTQFNNNVAAMVNARNDSDIFMVDMENGAGIVYTSFTTNGGDMGDDLHPYATGYEKMADKWLGEINPLGLTSCLLPPRIHLLPEAAASVGQLFTYSVLASGNPAPTFDLTVSPSGMTINTTTGEINWTPTTAGTANVTVLAQNSQGDNQASFTISVSGASTQPNISSIPDQPAIVGTLFTYDVDASGNPAPTFSLLAPVPSGMEIDPGTGLIDWTPAAAGTFDVTVRATNSAGSDDESFTITVAPAASAPAITPIPGQSTVVNTLFTYDVEASGNPSPTFSLVPPVLEGMNIDSTSGVISWAPFTAGTFTVTVRASNSEGSDDETFTVDVLSTPAVTSIPNRTVALGQSFTYDADASGHPAPTFSLAQKPAGMTINATTGVINWTPTTTGTFTVTVKATNSQGSDQKSFTIIVTEEFLLFLPLTVGN